jgi:activator of HSP90 ATPase
MAKWGEGDPRWIVEERPDATNVNNWHWSEKNASQWSRDKLKELLLNLKFDESGVGYAEIYEITSIEGEAVANNRKAKLIFFYEWVLKLKWRGCMNGQSDEIEGTIDIPNLSEENDASEIDVNVSLKKEGGMASDILKDMVRIKGADAIRDQLAKYISQLKTDFAKDLIKPTNNSSAAPVATVTKEVTKSIINNGTDKPAGKAVAAGAQIEVKDLNLCEEFKCTKEDVYKAFTVQEMVSAFSRGQAIVDAKSGGKFSMFDSNVTGTFTALEPNKEIKQKWRFRSWPEGHYSTVTLKFEEKEDHTNVVLQQIGIPANDYERTENGWKQFYFRSLKQTFGFGSTLY